MIQIENLNKETKINKRNKINDQISPVRRNAINNKKSNSVVTFNIAVLATKLCHCFLSFYLELLCCGGGKLTFQIIC